VERFSGALNRGASANLPDGDKSHLWPIYPALKPERVWKTRYTPSMATGRLEAMISASSAAIEPEMLGSWLSGCIRVEDRHVWIHRCDRGFTKRCSRQAFPPDGAVSPRSFFCLRRRAVLEAVAALGYTSNHAASSLRRGKTRTVGIVVPNLGNEFYGGLSANGRRSLRRAISRCWCGERRGRTDGSAAYRVAHRQTA